MSAAFLINPNSNGDGKKGKRLADELARSTSFCVEFLNEFKDLQDILETFAAKGITALFISSGDGTIQAIQTLIAEYEIFESLPELALLPHGSTNMDAGSLGLMLKKPNRIADFAQNLNKARRKKRHTIRIANPVGKSARHGMFVGTGAVRGAVEYSQAALNNNNIRGEIAPFVTLFTLVARYLISGGDKTISKPYRMEVKIDGELVAQGNLLVFLATSLEHLVLKSRPYWGPDTSDLKALSVAYPPPNVLRYLAALMYGIPNRNLPESCQSRAAQTIEVSGSTGWVVDGEFFDAPSNEPLRLELGTEFTYLCNPL